MSNAGSYSDPKFGMRQLASEWQRFTARHIRIYTIAEILKTAWFGVLKKKIADAIVADALVDLSM